MKIFCAGLLGWMLEPATNSEDSTGVSWIRSEGMLKILGLGWAQVIPMVTGALDTPTAAAEGIQSTARETAERLKSEADASYKIVENAANQPVLSQRGLMETASDAIAMLRKEVGPAMRAEMPNLSKQLKKLEKLVKIAKNPNFKGAPLRAIDDYQRALGVQIKQAMAVGGNASEGRALTMLKNQLNEAYNTAIERGIDVWGSKRNRSAAEI